MSSVNTPKNFPLYRPLRALLNAAVRKVRDRGEEGASQAVMVLILVPVFLFAWVFCWWIWVRRIRLSRRLLVRLSRWRVLRRLLVLLTTETWIGAA